MDVINDSLPISDGIGPEKSLSNTANRYVIAVQLPSCDGNFEDKPFVATLKVLSIFESLPRKSERNGRGKGERVLGTVERAVCYTRVVILLVVAAAVVTIARVHVCQDTRRWREYMCANTRDDGVCASGEGERYVDSLIPTQLRR